MTDADLREAPRRRARVLAELAAIETDNADWGAMAAATAAHMLYTAGQLDLALRLDRTGS